jgi:hypothetical protein
MRFVSRMHSVHSPKEWINVSRSISTATFSTR